MKLGIGSGAYWSSTDLAAGLARMKKHGFDCTDYQKFTDTEAHPELFECTDAEFDARVLEDAAALAAAGIEVYQTHGPWRYPPRDSTEEDRDERFRVMSRALRGTRLLGCRYMVIHPFMPFGTGDDGDIDEYFRINEEMYRRLCAVAEQENVIICLENMPMPRLPLATPEQILDFVKKIDSPWLRVCLDTGHSAVCGVPAGEAVRLLGNEYLRVLHVHDNNGKSDQHLLPYSGVTDWKDFGQALKDIGYAGSLSLECSVARNLPESIKEYHQLGLVMIAREIIR